MNQNLVLDFVATNWARLNLDRFGPASGLSCVLLCPRMRITSRLIFFVFCEGAVSPILVVKVPRRDEATAALVHEALNVQMARAAWPGGSESIPETHVFEGVCGHTVVTESAMGGDPMTSGLVCLNRQACLESVAQWILDLHVNTVNREAGCRDWYRRLVHSRFETLRSILEFSSEEERLLARTCELVAPLQAMQLPLVFEHGDFCEANILTKNDGRGISVVDWETAEPEGLPASDLFFFLAFIGREKVGVRSQRDWLRAFRATFFGSQAWARPNVQHYSELLGLPREALKLLFLACWSRYLITRVEKLSEPETASPKLNAENAAWFRRNPYLALWQYTVTHFDELNLT